MAMKEMLTAEEEQRLLEEAKAGSAEALERLAERYQERIYGFAFRMCRDQEAAKEILQETFLSAIRYLKDFRGESRLGTWLYRIAANACAKLRHREAGPSRELPLEDLLPRDDGEKIRLEIPEPDAGPEARAIRGELGRRIEAALDRLPAQYKAVLVLRDLEDLSTEEVGQVLGLTEANVKSRLHRARLFLRRELERYVRERL